MFERFRAERAQRRENAAVVDALFAGVAEAARRAPLYTVHGVADTVMGRYEMMALHMWLFQHRAKGVDGTGASPQLEAMAQEVVDAFFKEIDHTLREIGIGDTSVPKRMKKLARMVYGRWDAYRTALDAGDREAMAEAMRRNVYSESGDAAGAPGLADYVFDAATHLAGQDDAAFLAGRIDYPNPVQRVAA